MAQERVRNRPERIPVHERSVISFKGKDNGYEYRLVNDKEDRVSIFKDAGYEVVRSDLGIGDDKAGEGTSLGSIVTKSVGRGIKGVLLRIPKDLYEEDQRKKLEKLKATDAALKNKTSNAGEGFYGGKLEIKS
jgi:hypothetical protein